MSQIPAHILAKMIQVLDGAIVKQSNGCIWFNIDRSHISLNNKNVVRVRIFKGSEDHRGREYCKSAMQLVFYKHHGYFPPRNHIIKPLCNSLNCGNIAHLTLDKQGGDLTESTNLSKAPGIIKVNDPRYLPVRRNYKAEKQGHDSGQTRTPGTIYTSVCVSVTDSGSDEEIMERVQHEYGKANELLNELIDKHFKTNQ